MSNIDHLALDGRALRTFLAVLEEGSVTGAAERLGVTQSAVSHTLEKLRAIARDPLFVKSGRRIVATAHAQSLAEKARMLLDDLKGFTAGSQFHPAGAAFPFTVAANDFQRDLLLPPFFRRVREATAGIRLCIMPSGAPSADLLRENRCDLIVSPIPPSGTDIIQKRLLQDDFVCFYDPAVRNGPETLDDYLNARHVTVVFDASERLEFDKTLETKGLRREVDVTVPNFSGVPAFLRGSDLVATVPSLLRLELMRGFAWVRLPLESTALPVYMVWHKRHHLDPAHRWLRSVMEEVTRETLERVSAARSPL